MANPVKAPVKQGTSKAPITPQKPGKTPSQVAAEKAAQAAKGKEAEKPVEVKHPEPKHDLLVKDKALTPGKAKVLLGWETENEFIGKLKAASPDLNEDAVKFGADFFLNDLEGNKVRLKNNTRNRPWSESVSKAYMFDILMKQWRFNGEPIIIGQSGRILSGQHRLIGLVFAEQQRAGEAEGARWQEIWGEGPVTLETAVIYGIDESPETTRTIDNVKSRSLSDVIYADTELFGKMKAGERKTAAKMLDYAVKLLWVRTGEDKDGGFKPVRTHSTSLSFVDRHKKLRECIAHILEEEKGDQGRVSQYIYPGLAAGLMYMMACAGTDEKALEDYHIKRPTDEKRLKFDNMKKAKMFWSDLARGAPEMKQVRMTRFPKDDDGVDDFNGFVFPTDKKVDGGTLHERKGVIVKAWNLFVKDEELKDLELGYKTEQVKQADDSEVTKFHLVEYPTIRDSIDIGEAPKPKKVKEAATTEVELGDTENEEENPDGDTPNALEEVTDEQGEAKAKEASEKQEATQNQFRVKWTADKQQYGDHVLLYKGKTGNSIAYFDDATVVAEVLGVEAREHPVSGATQVVVGADEFEEACSKIHEAGNHILVVDTTGDKGNRKVSPWAPEEATEGEEQGEDESATGGVSDSGEEESSEQAVEEATEGETSETEPEPEPVKEQPKQPERLKQVARRVVRKK